MATRDDAIGLGMVFQLVGHQGASLLAHAHASAGQIPPLDEIVDMVGFQIDGWVGRLRLLAQSGAGKRKRGRTQQDSR